MVGAQPGDAPGLLALGLELHLGLRGVPFL